MARTEEDLGPERTPGIQRAASSVLILAAIFLLSYSGIRPTSAKPSSAPATEFSAARAVALLSHLLIGDTPHPLGSSTDELVRNRIVAELTRLGYAPQVQSAFDCNDYGSCATVNNVVARLDGSDGGQGGAVLLSAHYDSVPAGPGASDDGTSVAAVLEIARVLKELPKQQHSIILLLNEGEEAGLLGARAFMDSHPWAREVRVVVNLDARGTSGPSMLFETGTANEWTIRLFQKVAARPLTSSIFYSVYKQLPSDTDMTVFKSAAVQGANFAFIGSQPQYHTPLDNLANVNASSVQHQGDNALGMVTALANADLAKAPEKEAVFFDVFGRHIFEWPQGRAVWLGLIAAVLFAGQIALLFGIKRMTPREFLSGVTGFGMALITTGALALILNRVLRFTGAIPVNWIAHPLAVRLAFWLLALSVVVVHGIAFSRRAGFWGLWAGVWAWWALTGLVLGWAVPSASYLIQVPTCAAMIVGLPVAVWGRDSAFAQWCAGIVPMAAAAVVGFTPLILLYTAVGNSILPVLAILVALTLTPLIPLCVDLSSAEGLLAVSIPGVPILAGALATFIAIVVPAYSAQSPERVNLQFWQDADSGKAQWVVSAGSGRLPDAIGLAASFHGVPSGEIPWERGPLFLSDAPALDVGAPTFTVVDSSAAGEKRQFRALLRSERGAPAAMVMFPPDSGVQGVSIEDVRIPSENNRTRQALNGWIAYQCPAMPAKGVELSFTLPVGKPVVVNVIDYSYSLPDEGTFLVKARPLTAVPSGQGDVTILSRRVQLNP